MGGRVTADEIAQRLKKPKGRNGKWEACCPAHEDSSPSLSIGTGRDGRVLLHCHANCPPITILEALGLTVGDLFPTKGTGERHGADEILTTYDYTDITGSQLLFQVVRLSGKRFRQRRPGPEGGWFWNIEGVPRVIYKWPRIAEAVTKGETVYITEGEKDALTLELWNLPATTNAMGAGKWKPEHTEALLGAPQVVILPDNDGPGIAHSKAILDSLTKAQVPARIAPPFPGAKDVTDWVIRGGTLDTLLAHVAPPAADRIYRTLTELLADPKLLEPPPIVIPRLAWEGRVTLLAAREKVGKSTLMGQAAAALARAPQSILGDDILEPMNTLWLGLDEPVGDIVRRFDRYGLTQAILTDRIAIRNLRPDLAVLVQAIREHHARLVVLDHLTEYAAGHVKDPNSPTEYQPLLKDFRVVAQETGAAFVLLHHASKAGGYRDSTQIGAGVDAIVLMQEDEKDEAIRVCKCRGRVAVADFRLTYLGGYYETTDGGVSLNLQIQRVIRSQPGCSTRAIVSQVHGKTETVMGQLTDIETSGLIQNRGNGTRSAWYTSLPINGLRMGNGGGNATGNGHP